MFNLFKKKKSSTNTLVSPCHGKMISIEKVADPMFAAKSMGDGFAIQFDGDCVKSCCDGEVTVCFPTGHAFGIKTEMGNEILIHIGIDTVEMKGEGFEVKVTPGTKVKKGDLLVTYTRQNSSYEISINVIAPCSGTIFLFSENGTNYGVISSSMDNIDSVKAWALKKGK